MNNAYTVCTMVQTYGPHIEEWMNTKRDDGDQFFIIDKTNQPDFTGGFGFTENEIREKFNFHEEVSKKNFWNCVGNKTVVWFYAHFRMLNFYLEYPNYDYYWFFDDDIKMDDWNLFFDSINKDNSDFIAYFCFKNKGVTSQIHVPEINMKSFSNYEWFKRFPGHGAKMPKDIPELFGSFFPTVRFSNLAMSKLLETTREGYSAYHEGFVPTILNKMGLKLRTIINPDNTSDFFDVDKVNILHKNIRVTWEWI